MRKRWKIFADEYMRTWNATQAYSIAYPLAKHNTAGANGHRLLNNAEILAYIHDRQMKAEEIIGRFEEQARGVADYYDLDTGQLEIRRLIADGKGHLIKKQEKTMGTVKVEFYDAQYALTQLAKHQKLLTDKSEVDFGDKTTAIIGNWIKNAEKIYAEPGDREQDNSGSA